MSILRIELDLQDMFAENYEEDGGECLHDAIKGYIVTSAVSQIRQKCHKDIDSTIDKASTEIIAQKLEAIISEKIATAIDNPNLKIKERYSNEELTIDEAIKNQIRKVLDNSNITGIVTEKMKTYIADLKKAYDLTFASKVVDALHEKGMLNHEGLKSLIHDSIK